MRTMLILTLLVATFAAAPVASATYYNYDWYSVHVNGDNSVSIVHQSCTGYGTFLPVSALVVSSVPNPASDCRPVGHDVTTLP